MSKNAPEPIDPAVSLLEEIEDQDLAVSGGTDPITISVYTVTSYVIGNKGYVCTATVECQNNCRH